MASVNEQRTGPTTSIMNSQQNNSDTTSHQRQYQRQYQNQHQHKHHEGLLFKRRDVFNREWRPRWFVLHSDGMLTYYLLSTAQDQPPAIKLSSASTPVRNSSSETTIAATTATDSLNYDTAVPRGNIYLRGCQCMADERHSQVNIGIFCLTITAPNKTKIHLAATSAESRAEWLHKLRSVANERRPRDLQMNGNDSTHSPVTVLSLNDPPSSQEEPPTKSEQSLPTENQAPVEAKIEAAPPQDLQTDRQQTNGTENEETTESHYAHSQNKKTKPSQPSSTNNSQPPVAEPQTSTPTRWTTIDEESVYSGLHPDMRDAIQSRTDDFLPLCLDHRPEHNWDLIFKDKDGVTCHTRQLGTGETMMKSVAIIDHHPKQVFNLIIDIKRRQQFEQNVRFDKRLKQCNPFTFIDYYAYRAVWPTSARDFLVLLHWRVLTRGSEKAILACGFSYPQADHLFPTPTDHVRGKLHIAMFLMRLTDDNRCEVTRLLSYDLAGKIPPSLTSTIMQQQSSLPRVIADYLSRAEPDPPAILKSGNLDNDCLIRHVINNLAHEGDGLVAVRRQLRFTESFDSWSAVPDEKVESLPEPPKATSSHPTPTIKEELSPIAGAIILLSPVFIWRVLSMMGISDGKRATLFLISVYQCVRLYLCAQLGPRLPERSQVGIVSCRFDINLRGVLRYLAVEKDKSELELSVIHMVVHAIGKALKEMEVFNSKKINIPFLGINGSFINRRTVDVSLMDAEDNFLTFQDCSALTLQDVARRCGNQSATINGTGLGAMLTSLVASLDLISPENVRGSVLVVACPDSEGSEVVLDVIPKSNDFNAVVTIGGVRLSQVPQPKSVNSPTPKRVRMPHLAMTISFACPSASIVQCRQFAERVQQLVERPQD